MARRYYKMTAARKAALRKAQIASAKKRRRRKVAGGVAVGAAAIAVGAGGGYYVQQRTTKKRNAKAYSKFKEMVTRPALPSPPPKPTPRKRVRRGGGTVSRNGVAYGNANNVYGKRVFKTSPQGQTHIIKRQRGVYDWRQRNKYDPMARREKYFTKDKKNRKSRAKK